MATLNVTYQGRSADAPQPVDERLSDADIRRIAVELVRTGALPGLIVAELEQNAFTHFVVDRFTDAGTVRIYLRPKVPFGQ
jgi:hypothetical protein